ncbi:MAG: hypothetical protein K0Q87_3415 [Neobacillus sp.]|nr:hypothetical protein [Neobacillus sp.]
MLYVPLCNDSKKSQGTSLLTKVEHRGGRYSNGGPKLDINVKKGPHGNERVPFATLSGDHFFINI